MKTLYEKTVKEIPDVEAPAVEYAERRGWLVLKFVSPGHRGVPDRFFARAGRVMFIEFKATGKEAKRQQRIRHRELRDHGVEVYECDNLEYAHELLK